MIHWIDQYIDTIQHLLAGKMVLAPLLLLFVEEAGIPLIVPGDIIIAYTGYRVATTNGVTTQWEAFIMAQLAVLSGASVLFILSRLWGQKLLHKLGAFVFLKERHLDRAEQLFARYGVFGIIFGRHIPGLRIPVTFFAASSGIRYRIFLASTFISTSIWVIICLTIGRKVGTNFHDEFQRYSALSLAAMAAIVLGIILLHVIGVYRRRRRSSVPAGDSE